MHFTKHKGFRQEKSYNKNICYLRVISFEAKNVYSYRVICVINLLLIYECPIQKYCIRWKEYICSVVFKHLCDVKLFPRLLFSSFLEHILNSLPVVVKLVKKGRACAKKESFVQRHTIAWMLKTHKMHSRTIKPKSMSFEAFI